MGAAHAGRGRARPGRRGRGDERDVPGLRLDPGAVRRLRERGGLGRGSGRRDRPPPRPPRQLRRHHRGAGADRSFRLRFRSRSGYGDYGKSLRGARGGAISGCAERSRVSGWDRHGVIGGLWAESCCRWVHGCRGDSRDGVRNTVIGAALRSRGATGLRGWAMDRRTRRPRSRRGTRLRRAPDEVAGRGAAGSGRRGCVGPGPGPRWRR